MPVTRSTGRNAMERISSASTASWRIWRTTFTWDSTPGRTPISSPASCCATGGCGITGWRADMELYYNPEQMPDAEIKQTFVGRGPLAKELLGPGGGQPKGGGGPPGVVVGPPGMG